MLILILAFPVTWISEEGWNLVEKTALEFCQPFTQLPDSDIPW